MGAVDIGLKNLVYAKLLTDPIGGTPTYDTVTRIAGAISANFNPNGSTETLFADDGPFESASTLGNMSLELNVADISSAVQADLLGHKISGGILKKTKDDTPPWVAIGYARTRSDGSATLVWLNKCKFAPGEQSSETKGESINWNTPTISASIVAREADGEYSRVTNRDTEGYTPDLVKKWFTSPTATA